MGTFKGRVSSIQLDPCGMAAAWIACPPGAIPAPGQYVLAHAPADADAPLAVPLFAGEVASEGFLAVPPVPAAWMPGAPLHLRGPLGHGFSLDDTANRLALAALDNTIARLMPLATVALAQDMAVTLYANGPLPPLPSALEVYPLSALPEALAWADQLALDLSLPTLPGLRACLGLNPQEHLPCQAQVLILTPMPCGGLADCGACAVPSRRGWKLACKDGPVFDINDLEW